MKKKTLKIILAGILTIVFIAFIVAKVKRVSPLAWSHFAVNQSMFSDEAINGYDPVAYFTLRKAVKGYKLFSYKWKNATWYFGSDSNMNVFKADPGKYAPQCGGYCAFAASKGFTANTDPNAFQIINNKLYLFADETMMHNWLSGGEESRNKSESNWN